MKYKQLKSKNLQNNKQPLATRQIKPFSNFSGCEISLRAKPEQEEHCSPTITRQWIWKALGGQKWMRISSSTSYRSTGTVTNTPAGKGKDLCLQKMVFLCLLSITSFGIVILGGGCAVRESRTWIFCRRHNPENTKPSSFGCRNIIPDTWISAKSLTPKPKNVTFPPTNASFMPPQLKLQLSYPSFTLLRAGNQTTS